MVSKFKVIQLPGSYDSGGPQRLLQTLAQKSKSLRLQSLKSNPEAFSSTYEREIAFEDAIWENRLKNTEARTLICLDMGNHEAERDGLDAAAEAPWVGVTVLVGPRTLEGPYPPPSGEVPWKAFPAAVARALDAKESAGKTSAYVINAVYVTPLARGKGLGKELIERAVEVSREEFQKNRAAGEQGVCLVFVSKDNEPAAGLYQACGFEMDCEDEHAGGSGQIALMKRLG
jgi:GNAT superfamily N-acetyltransferase